MIHSGQFDKDLGAMVRDPKNANKTASELLKMQEGRLRAKLIECNCTDKLRRIFYVVAIFTMWLLGILLWPR